MSVKEINITELIEKSYDALSYAYSPYSGFSVGAALLCANGDIYTGCNIENVSFSPTNCAERTAVFKAVSEGVKEFIAICIIAKKNGMSTSFTPPCGVCLQVLSEFCDAKKFSIILAKNENEYKVFTLKELLPQSFDNF